MSQEKFWILFSKKLSGEASKQEIAELEELIHQHPEWQYAIQNLEDLWSIPVPTHRQEDEDAYLIHVQRLREQLPFGGEPEEIPAEPFYFESERHSRRRRNWLMATALTVLIALVSFFAFRQRGSAEALADSQPVPGDISEISTRLGSKSKVQLPDGSVVWLNAGSKLTYDKEFGQSIREVRLEGEGFFDVVKNKEKPFVIHTRAIDIKVLGTAFNVKAYPDDKATETSLIRGSIEVAVKNRPNEKIILSPNEKLVVMNQENEAGKVETQRIKDIKPEIAIRQLQYSPVDSTLAETQWVENRLVFRDESFDELVKKLERWYNVIIEIRDPALRDIHLSGTFSNETVEQALQAMIMTSPFHYEVKPDRITIYK